MLILEIEVVQYDIREMVMLILCRYTMSACSDVRSVRYSSKARKVMRATLQTGTLPGNLKNDSQVNFKGVKIYSSSVSKTHSGCWGWMVD